MTRFLRAAGAWMLLGAVLGLAAPAAPAAPAPPLLWSAKLSGYVDKPTAADLNGDGLLELVMGTDNGNAVAISGQRGVRLWIQPYEGEAFRNCPVIADVDGDEQVEMIFTGGRNGLVVCLEGRTGGEEWRRDSQIRRGIFGTPALGDLDGNGSLELVYIEEDVLFALNAADGTELWQRPLDDETSSPVALIDVDGGTPEILFGLNNGNLLCYDGSGRPKWSARIGGRVSKTPIGVDGNGDGRVEIYAVGERLYRLTGDGQIEWGWNPPQRGVSSGLAAGDVNADGQIDIVAASYNGKLYAISNAGKPIWEFNVVAPREGGAIPYTPGSTPAVVDITGDGAADIIMASPASDDPKIFALDGRNARPLWVYPASRFSQCCPLVLDLDGDGRVEVVASVADGMVYALKTNAGPRRGWIKYDGDLANTGFFPLALQDSAALLQGRYPATLARVEVPWDVAVVPGGTTPPPTGPTTPPVIDPGTPTQPTTPPVTPPTPVEPGPTQPTPTQPTPTEPTTPPVTPPTPTIPPVRPTPTGSSVRPNTPVAVMVNGLWLEPDAPPAIVDGRVLVPLRAIFEALNANVEFNAATKAIRATRGETVVNLQIGSQGATINSRSVQLDVPATVIDGRTFVPVRFVSEALGAAVNWDPQAKNVMITSR